MTLLTLIEQSQKETSDNRRKALNNLFECDIAKLESYDNSAFLDLIDFMNDYAKKIT